MKKIRITESQLKMIKMSENKGVRNIKISETQLAFIQEAIKAGKLEKNIDKNFKDTKMLSENIEFVDFSREVMLAINNIFNDTSQAGLSPFWVKLGVTRGELAELLIGCGIIYSTTLATGIIGYKMARKGFIGGMKRLYNVIIGRRYDMYNKGKVINTDTVSGQNMNDTQMTEDGGYPVGAENDPNAPWNRGQEEREPQSQHNHFQIIENFGDYALLTDPQGNKFYIDLANFYYDTEADNEFIENKINVAVESGELKIDGNGTDLFLLNTISIITPENKAELIANTENPQLEAILNELAETTTTGSVGGSYETPFFLSNNSEKGKFFDDPMIKGGQIVKKKSRISEDDKVAYERYSLTLQMLIYGENEEMAKRQAFGVENYLNRKYDGNATIKSLIKNNYGEMSSSIGEQVTDGLVATVEFDDCTKLNNNKVAQNGGCSVGAVDNVVKIKTNKNNI